jgi:hypothetical protein
MNKEISTHLFVQAIEDAGATGRKTEVDAINGFVFQDFVGPNGEGPVTVTLSKESIPETTGRVYLIKLGLLGLADRGLFQ